MPTPGVFRPYTFQDVIATLNQQTAQLLGSQVITGLSDFAEVDETTTASDSAFASPTLNPTWGNGEWGSVLWS